MKYHALFVIFKKKQQNLKMSAAVNLGGALWIKIMKYITEL